MISILEKPVLKYLLMSALLTGIIMLAGAMTHQPLRYILVAGGGTFLVCLVLLVFFRHDQKKTRKVYLAALAAYSFLWPPAALYYFTRITQEMFRGKSWGEVHLGLWFLSMGFSLVVFLLGLGLVILCTIILVNIRGKKKLAS